MHVEKLSISSKHLNCTIMQSRVGIGMVQTTSDIAKLRKVRRRMEEWLEMVQSTPSTQPNKMMEFLLLMTILWLMYSLQRVGCAKIA